MRKPCDLDTQNSTEVDLQNRELEVFAAGAFWHRIASIAEQKQVVRGLKSLALELQIPVILISQLRKALQNEDRTKPTISRLYGSGSKVKTASIIL